MVPFPNRDSDGDDRTAPDGGADPGFDEAALFPVVRAAVKDAMLDVLGTVLLVFVGGVLVLVGVQLAFGALDTSAVAAGIVLAAFGTYVAASALELVPSVAGVLDR
ncbi:hypothetical protein [Halorientalis litorea]|uniref:hypothetical protein n=1 Tax=Halorientalis litorea TaxID=2931977 RepID=UPI001FF387F6|nr:hypothetical protein [Halorientalis litorea]